MSTSAGMPETMVLPTVPDASWLPLDERLAASGDDAALGRPVKVAFMWPGAMLHYVLMLASYPSAAAAVVVIAELRHRPYPVMMAWSGVILAACLAPVGMWVSRRRRTAPPAAVTEPDPDAGNQVDAETTLLPRRDAPQTTPAPRLRS